MQQKPLFNHLNTALSPVITVDQQHYLYFGGTAYLGIPQHKEFIQLYQTGIKRFGLNNGTSRGNNVQLGIYNDAESYAAEKFGAKAALITSSGYLAAQLTIKQLQGLGEIRYAPASHPALWLNEQPKVGGSFNNWAAAVTNEINTSEKQQWVIISNSMNNLLPEIYDFSFIKHIVKEKQIILIVDDSHGIGINNNGLGAFSSIPTCNNVQTVVVASMAKALGVDAGLVLGAVQIIDLLKQSNEFLGASPPAAAGLYAFMGAAALYNKTLKKLKQNMLVVNNKLIGNEDWSFVPEFPVFFSKNAELYASLLKRNILISSFPYPDKDGAIINRIVLSSRHKKTELKKLIECL